MVARLGVVLGPAPQHFDRPGTHERIGDFERLLAGIGLGNHKIVDIDAELAGIAGVKRMFGIDEGADAAALLRFGDGLERQCRLA